MGGLRIKEEDSQRWSLAHNLRKNSRSLNKARVMWQQDYTNYLVMQPIFQLKREHKNLFCVLTYVYLCPMILCVQICYKNSDNHIKLLLRILLLLDPR